MRALSLCPYFWAHFVFYCGSISQVFLVKPTVNSCMGRVHKAPAELLNLAKTYLPCRKYFLWKQQCLYRAHNSVILWTKVRENLSVTSSLLENVLQQARPLVVSTASCSANSLGQQHRNRDTLTCSSHHAEVHIRLQNAQNQIHCTLPLKAKRDTTFMVHLAKKHQRLTVK